MDEDVNVKMSLDYCKEQLLMPALLKLPQVTLIIQDTRRAISFIMQMQKNYKKC